jgi:hypothetical protein
MRRKRARGEARAWLLGIARNVLAASLERGRVESQARERLGMETLRVSEQTISGVEMIVIESGEAVVREWLDGLPASERHLHNVQGAGDSGVRRHARRAVPGAHTVVTTCRARIAGSRPPHGRRPATAAEGSFSSWPRAGLSICSTA